MFRGKAVNQLLLIASILLFLLLATRQVNAQVHQDLNIKLLPDNNQIIGTVVLTPATPQKTIYFWLNSKLTLKSALEIAPLKRNSVATLYAVTSPVPLSYFTISYDGRILNPPVNDQSIGTIETRGVSLLGETYWYPAPQSELLTFSLTVTVPEGWTPVTNARLENSQNNVSVFKELAPQEDIYLIAAPFVSYQLFKDGIQYQVLLRTDDSKLASTYLDLLPNYMQQYQRSIGPYAYSQFSVVENFWETGYGMPGFTLLGSSVMRLPFILTSSLPHELLHSWWGNGVYVDYSLGNWCEGLTTYQADYWQQRLAKSDRTYRLNKLIEYNDFVTSSPDSDFPLVEFKGRHDSASQAIGYGKTLMMFDMLESRIGTFQFTRSLQHFYKNNLHKKATYLDLKNSFEFTTRSDLEQFFNQWWLQKGAPKISLISANKRNTLLNWVVSINLALEGQYNLDVPVRITGTNRSEVQILRLSSATQSYTLELKYDPIKIEIDPDFRLFRHIYPQERPLTLSGIFGQEQLIVMTDSHGSEAADLPNLWRNRFKGEVTVSPLNSTLPKSPVVIIGKDQATLSLMSRLTRGGDIEVDGASVTVNGKKYDLSTKDVALLIPHPELPNTPLMWMSVASETDFNKWAPRLTHYGTFGYLVFEKTAVVVKGSLPSGRSPLKQNFF